MNTGMANGSEMEASGKTQRNALKFLVIVLLLLSPLLLLMAAPFLTSFILALILATLIHPLKNRLSQRLHRPALATFIITLASVMLLSVLVSFVGFSLTKELGSAYTNLNRRSLQEGGWPTFLTHTADRMVDTLAGWVPVDKEAIRAGLLASMRSVTGYLLNKVGATLGGVTSFLITSLLVTIFLYFLLRYGEEWIRRVSAEIPLDPRTTARLFRTVHQSIIANVNGVVIVAASQGIFLTLGFWFVGLQSPVTWGIFGGLTSVIPIFGAPLVWIPFVISFAFQGLYWKALGLGLWGALVVGSLDNVLRPLVVGARQKQHPGLTAMTMIGGTYAFGAVGILLGPVIASLTIAVLQDIRNLMPRTPASTVPAEENRQSVPVQNLDP